MSSSVMSGLFLSNSYILGFWKNSSNVIWNGTGLIFGVSYTSNLLIIILKCPEMSIIFLSYVYVCSLLITAMEVPETDDSLRTSIKANRSFGDPLVNKPSFSSESTSTCWPDRDILT